VREEVGSGARVLDVGCGKGLFVEECVRAGLQAEGIDLSGEAVRAGVGRGVRLYQRTVEEFKEGEGRYDAVTFWATVEHLPRPLSTLSAMFALLKPGGRLFLDTGIGDDWLDRLLPGVTQWYDPPQHLFVFSEDGMRRLLSDAGFIDIRIDRCFERTQLRKVVRIVRGAVVASALRLVSDLGRLRTGRFEFRRYPLGNLMSVRARRP